MTERGWKEGKGRAHYFVTGDGQLWLSTARISKRNAIAAWIEQAYDEGDRASRMTWRYWYGRGYRAVRAKIKFKIIR